jgi:hypothetical protein
MSKYAKVPSNKNTHFLCIFVCIFSKYMSVYPMKFKDTSEILRVMKPHLNNTKTGTAFAESAVRIIKTRIEKWMHYANCMKYIPILSDLMTSYNNTVNTKTKFKPIELLNDSETASEAWYNQFKSLIETKSPKPKLKMGNWGRIAINVILFRKGYEETHSEEIFKIIKVIKTE